MDKAIQIGFGQSNLVTASEVKKKFRGHEPSNMRFRCPLCNRPVSPCSMNDRNTYVPYFKHQQNDPIAHKCELFARSFGYGTVYKRVPLPMFIRPPKEHGGIFVIEVGMRPIGAEHIDAFERNKARLWVEKKPFNITKARFCGETFKARIEKLSMKPSEQVKIENLPKEYEHYWGSIEDPTRAMVFSCDPISEQGQRLKTGDCVSEGVPFYLVTSDSEAKLAKMSFSDAEHVGSTSRRGHALSVLKVVVPVEGGGRQKAETYLADCGFGVVDYDPTPVSVWPPALQGSGDIIPLFKKAPSVFVATVYDDGADCGSWLYQHSDESRGGEPRRFPLRRVIGTNQGLCVMKRTRMFCFVGARNDAFAAAALVRDMDIEMLIPTEDSEQGIAIEEREDAERREFRITSPVPISVKKLVIGKPNINVLSDEDSGEFVFFLGPREAILLETAPPAFPVRRILDWLLGRSGNLSEKEVVKDDSRAKALGSTGASIALARSGCASAETGNTNKRGGYSAALLRARRKQ